MRTFGIVSVLVALLVGVWVGPLGAAEQKVVPIQSVTLGEHREFRVNGKPFLPIMLWLQSHNRIADGKAAAVNTFCANGGDLGDKAYLDALAENDLYGVLSVSDGAAGLKSHPHLLGWIHGDEPDMPRKKSDATVKAADRMNVNPKTPYARIVDGEPHSWTALDPLNGAEFTIKLDKPVTVERLAVWLTLSGEMPVARKMVFRGDGEKLLEAELEKKKGEQAFELPKPATFKELAVRVTETHEGGQDWGSIGEIQGYDASGDNVLLSQPYYAPRTAAEELAETYRRIKSVDPGHPVLMTFTAHFMKSKTGRYDLEAKKRVYPQQVQYCDVVGFDTYPVYGSGMPKDLCDVAEGVSELREIGGPKRPVYAWIETNKGSKWMTYEKQLDVKPIHTRSETWMALIRGATAIGYFTHAWRPEYTQFRPKGEMLEELNRLNSQLARLAPAILAAPAEREVAIEMKEGTNCHLKATQHDGALWIFAQNLDLGPNVEKLGQFDPISPRSATGIITVEGLKEGATVKVVDEGRAIEAGAGRFTDDFDPLIEHVYRIEF